MVMTTAVRDAAVGLEIATGNFAETPAITAVVAYGLISTIGALGLAWVLAEITEPAPKGLPVR
jgi:BASS family bile acid:Na+ symporter